MTRAGLFLPWALAVFAGLGGTGAASGGRPRKTSERTAARSAPFVRTDCRAETQIRPKPHFTQAVKTSPRPNPCK